MSILKDIYSKVSRAISDRLIESYQYSEHQLIWMGAIGFVFFPVYYFIWNYIFPQAYADFKLRMVGSILCLGMLLKNYWPVKLRKILPIYWYITVTYSLPFFSTYVCLKTNFATVPLLISMMSLFLLLLLVDWVGVILIFTLGSALAWLCYFLTTKNAHVPVEYAQYLLIYLFTMLAGIVFNLKTALLQKKKLEGMIALSRTLAHELSTPLLSIKSAAAGIRKYYPVIFDGYQQAVAHGLKVEVIRSAHLSALLPTLKSIESEVDNVSIIMNILLANVRKKPPGLGEKAEVCYIVELVDNSLTRYPFQSIEEKNKIHWDKNNDFKVQCIKIFIVHVLFNLIKNSLYFMAKSSKGEIYINLTQDKYFNKLYFKDTGAGIPERNLQRIFDPFFTTSEMATGIGLAFCKMVMEDLGGSIQCNSIEGEFTEFVLSFPKVE